MSRPPASGTQPRPAHWGDWNVGRGFDGVQYWTRQISRGGPYICRPILPPRTASQLATMQPPTANDDEVDQAMKIHHEVNRAHLVAKDSLIIIKGVGAMAQMVTHVLTRHQIEVLNTRKGLLAHDVHYAAPLRIILPVSRQLRIRLIAGLGAQLNHIAAMLVQIKVLHRLATDPDDGDVEGPWDDAGNGDGTEAGPAAAPASS